jgi:hypothetical protein
VNVIKLLHLSIDFFGVAFSNSFSYVEVIVRRNNTILSVLLVKELSKALGISLQKGSTSLSLLAEVLFDESVSKG